MSAPLLYLDCDGVLNQPRDRHANCYNPLHPRHVWWLNRILAEVPDAKIVVTSSWRYHVLSGRMTLEGLTEMFCHFGINAFGRVLDVTPKDPYHVGDPETEGWSAEKWRSEGIRWRGKQILKHWGDAGTPRLAILDDLPLQVLNLVRTHEAGLTEELADRVIQLLKGGDS